MCDTRLCYTSVCPLVLKYKPSQYAPHDLTRRRVTWPFGISQYTLQVWHSLAHGMVHGRVWLFLGHKGMAHGHVCWPGDPS
ncbi:jak1 [Gossypium arboreum]|uniref:Jak1 n=1 Tax=Gossypium arboreum TaxID=29729 RepID=A0A0B0N2S7_GOSAR|nr:jak1 [Gossypium arboreum]